VRRLQADLEAGELAIGEPTKTRRGNGGVAAEVAANCARLLDVFARFGILDAPD